MKTSVELKQEHFLICPLFDILKFTKTYLLA